ncbi:peptidoglycan editing factor PgeF [Guyparkeria sp.]|uniref:peptidoglycan editing factor PgeF n=1 Tax=Guyparkeria sp. TaxID=2035736 RepID=UPI003971052B
MSPIPTDVPEGSRFIEATWPTPGGVRAGVTTRIGGHSRPPFDGFNLATHVGDDPEAVAANRAELAEMLVLPEPPRWLNQTHGTAVVGPEVPTDLPEGDAAFTDRPGEVLAVLTADCLSVTLASHDGSEVAVAHAGWRGLAAGVIEQTVDRFSVAGDELMAWLGPAIGPSHFEVGEEVREAFMREYPADASAFRGAGEAGRFHADLFALARSRLRRQGITRVYGGERDTYALPELFYSYRRDRGETGRMATLVWREKD